MDAGSCCLLAQRRRTCAGRLPVHLIIEAGALMLRRSNGGARWWDANLTGGPGFIGFPVALAEQRNAALLKEARESDEVARIKQLGVIVDMGRDANSKGVVVINSTPLIDAGDRGWDLAFSRLLECLETYSSEGYIIILKHDRRVVLPSFSWVRKALFSISRRVRKGLCKLVIQSPSPVCRERLSYIESLVKEKSMVKVERTSDWRSHVPQESSSMIRAVLQGEDPGFDPEEEGAERRRRFEAEGLMYKKSAKNLLGATSWKKRWVRIDREALYIYKTASRPELGTEPKSVIILDGCTVSSVAGKRQRFAICLSLSYPLGRTVYLASKTEAEAEAWMQRMRRSSLFGKVFCVPIEEHLEQTGRQGGVPAVVETCVALLRQHALQLEGVLRVAGSTKRIEEHRLAFDILASASLHQEADMHTVAGLLKLYLRQLPQPLIPYAVYPKVLKAVETPSATGGGGGGVVEGCDGAVLDEEQLRLLAEALGRLPPANKRVLREVLELGADIARHHHVNKMPSLNVATVLAPNILRKGATMM